MSKKMCKYIYLLLMMCVCGIEGIIYQINETEYFKMPPLFAMDDYQKCLEKPGDTYCLAEFDLYSKEHSDLMNYIHEFSAYTIKHFNHTRIHRATCVTTTCKHFIKETETTPDIKRVLEECLNENIWNNYKIEVKLSKLSYCKKYDDRTILDFSDYIVAAVYAVIIMCNIIGSSYDYFFCRKDTKTENSYLLAFSLRRNWSKLLKPSDEGPDPRLRRLKLFNGLRSLTMVCVILAHSALFMSVPFLENPQYVEKTYDDSLLQLLYNGSLVTHTFFVMSSFLLAYNLQMQAEKHEITWMMIPKGILLRWIRLSAPYALILVTVSTWMRHLGSGPQWDMIVTNESSACREYWLSNMLYFNNYIHKYNACLSVAWYIAADTQLFCMGLILLVIIQKPRSRMVALILLFIASLIITAATTYFLNLDAIVIQAPETIRNLFTTSDTFNFMYIRGHTNLSTYVLGLSAGLLCYEWQKSEKDFSKFKQYGWLVWLIFPAGVAVIMSGSIFYNEGYIPSTLFTVVYATVHKPLFQMNVLVLIISSIFKIEDVYRGLLEWRGFTWTGKVSYSAYLLHILFLRNFVGRFSTTFVVAEYYLIAIFSLTLMLSYICGAVLWLFVEAPVVGLIRSFLTPKAKQ